MSDDKALAVEHVVCYCSLSDENMEYICRKANKLGLSGRDVHSVYTVQDGSSTHLYFETDPIKKNKN